MRTEGFFSFKNRETPVMVPVVPVALTKRNPPPEALIFDQIAAELEQRIGLTHEREREHGHASLMD